MKSARRLDTQGFLDRLGFRGATAPSVEGLFALHRAFVERVPYETIEIQLEKPTTLDPLDAADRIVRSKRGGYCYHLNGAFAALLEALGYEVTLHRAGVQNHDVREPGIFRNHLALTVRDVPDDRGTTWLVDVGLGDALHEPLPLVEGTYAQGPFTYALRRSEIAPGGFRLEHDPRGSFRAMDFDPAPATMADFAERHVFLSTSPESGFVRTCAVQRRDARGVDMMRALTLTRLAAEPPPRTLLESPAEWFGALADVFGLALDDVPTADRDRLWRKVVAQHESFVRASSNRGEP